MKTVSQEIASTRECWNATPTENLKAMVDFIYHGKANVYQENLESFLALADELQLKGLGRNQTDNEAEISEENSTPNIDQIQISEKTISRKQKCFR